MLIHAIKVKTSLIYAYSSVWLTLACLITLSDKIITPLELLIDVYKRQLHEAEQEAELTDKRFSSKDVLKAMKEAIGG